MSLRFSIATIAWIACIGTAIADETPLKLDGVYTIVSGEKNGTEIPADKLMGSIIKFDGETVLGTDKDKKEFFGCTFQIDKTTTPYTISMTSTAPMKGEKAVGIRAGRHVVHRAGRCNVRIPRGVAGLHHILVEQRAVVASKPVAPVIPGPALLCHA